MTFARPEALWLTLLAPLAALLAALLWRRQLLALRSWAAPGLWERLELSLRRQRLAMSVFLLAAAVLATAVGLARPRWGSVEQRLELSGVDIVFVLDSSLSMQTRDVAPSRIDIGKALVRRLLASLPGHRFGLVQAEGEGLVLAPLTVDTAVIDLLLDTVAPASLPQPGTRLAAAVDSALSLFPPESERHQVLVILSDGEDHGGGWRDTITALKEAHTVVHALGIGTVEGSPILIAEGAEPRYKQDSSGGVVVSRLHPEVLGRLVEASGGIYLEVSSAGVDPEPLVEAIDSMQKRALDGEVLDIQAERFQWPLTAAAVTLSLFLLVPPVPGREGQEGRS